MAGYALRLFGDPVLKQPARVVEEITPDLVPLVHGMYATMDDAEGVGLAAPQVGVRKRLFTYDLHEGDGPGVVINPEIVDVRGRDRVGRGMPLGARVCASRSCAPSASPCAASTSTAARSSSRATTSSPA